MTEEKAGSKVWGSGLKGFVGWCEKWNEDERENRMMEEKLFL